MIYTKFSNKNSIPSTITIFFILLGIGLIIFGFTINLNNQEETKNYISTKGSFIEATVYSHDSSRTMHSTTYALTYGYKVDGKEYKVTTDYGTSNVPAIGSTKTIKYNPTNPNEAIIVGGGLGTISLVFGVLIIIFIGISYLAQNANKNEYMVLGKIYGKASGILLSLFFVVMGILFYCISDYLWTFIIFLVIGIIILKLTVFSNIKILFLKVDRIENADFGYGYKIILVDDNTTPIYFIYEPTNVLRFQENRRYKVDINKYGSVSSVCYLENDIPARELTSFNDEDFVEYI